MREGMTPPLNFVVLSRAAPQGSKRHLGNGIMVESCNRVKPFRSDVRDAALSATPTDWDLGLEYHLRADFHFRRPASHLTTKGALTKAAPLHPTGRQIGDTDKLLRALCDAMTGVVWFDDSQVIDITAKKRYFDRDQVIISISPVNV